MCGIAGVFDYLQTGVPLDLTVFDRMVDALAHRGPDGRGTWHGEFIHLGHRRLSVLDPTPDGAQPMHDVARGNVVTFNGEVYNFRELRRELESHGHQFRTQCDTEVLLACYAEWGRAAVSRLNGMFAFALWDAGKRRLWLVRDRFGIKPLYYSLIGNVLRFGSEIKALLADPAVPRRPAADGIDAFLSFGFIPAPLTGFEGIKQLPAAHELVVENGEINMRRFWELSMEETPLSRQQVAEEFADRFSRAVSRRMISDVPLGAFLSGGLDSTAIVTEMTRHTGDHVHTFSVGFGERSFDEASHAASTARRLGTAHTELRVDFKLDEVFDDYMAQCDDPFADSSSLAVYYLCRAAAEHLTVALSGDGADELLGGYATYGATQLAVAYRRLPIWSRRLIRRGVGAIPASDRRYNFQQFASRFVDGAEEGEARDFASWRVHFREADKRLLCHPGFTANSNDPIGVYADLYRHAPHTRSRRKRMLYADLNFYLPNDMLTKVDRMSMAHGLEVRVPFLDHELAEFCARLPAKFLLRPLLPRQNKLILRRHVRDRLGRQVSNRRKTGFNVPIEKAMRTIFRSRFHDAVTSKTFRHDGPFDTGRLVEFSQQHTLRTRDAGHALFSAMVLANWWERWL